MRNFEFHENEKCDYLAASVWNNVVSDFAQHRRNSHPFAGPIARLMLCLLRQSPHSCHRFCGSRPVELLCRLPFIAKDTKEILGLKN
ncbi:hypothetical protein [Paraburkholderia sp. BR14374]|uniref:hypothetical protein n=1 Tax=Paraburkholderia sp. BR14374 TaxID=3237007 RepID=UPI0034CD3EC3